MQTLHYQLYVVTKPFLLKGKKRLKLKAWCSHCYNTPDKMICRCQFHTIFRHQTSYVDYDLDWVVYRWAFFECLSGSSQWTNDFVKVRDV